MCLKRCIRCDTRNNGMSRDSSWETFATTCATSRSRRTHLMAVIDQAIAGGIDLLICHRPLFFRSVHAVSGLGFRGEIVRKLNLAGCALWVGHTNADASYRGVSMAAADAFGLIRTASAGTHRRSESRTSGRIGPCRPVAGADRIA